MLSRFRFFILPVVTGAGLWLSFPGGGELWPLLFVALIPLLVAVRSESAGRAAAAGLIAGLAHFLPLLYWIVIVLGKYGGLAWYVSLQALLLLALYMSVYVVVFAAFARTILLGLPAVLALFFVPALWVGLDWLRGVLFTGFPWMDLGYGLYRIPLLVQIADVAGHHGVTFVIVFANTLLLLLFGIRRRIAENLVLVGCGICLLGGAGLYSSLRLAEMTARISAPEAARMKVGIVQGNIDQSIKWSPDQQQITVETYLALTASLMRAASPPDLVVWPETALPFFPRNEQLGPLKMAVKSGDMALLTGAPWYEIVDRQSKKVKYYNSAFLLAPDGGFAGKYFKSHLVPFGEYVPMKKLLPFLAPLVEAVGDFSSGTIDRPLVWHEAKAGILICFESVFPELSRQWVLAGANILVNLTNDAWYGKSSAPQHSLAMAVLRAVETRRSLIRSANTGISAFVNPAGGIEERSGLFEPWAAAREAVLMTDTTIWVRFGHLFAPFCLIMACCGTAVGRRLKHCGLVRCRQLN